MDHRTALKFDTVLHLGEHECHIEELLGSGSNSIVYKAWYYDRLNTDLKHHVLIKELFPFHPQRQIYRAENGAVEVAPEAMALWDSHRTSFETGNAIHLKLLEAQPELMAMGANINSFRYKGTLYSILGWSGGRSLKEELNRSAPQLRGTVHRMLALLDALEAFHESGYLHLDISPDNIMLTGQNEKESAFLIDYNSVRPMGCRERGFLSSKPGFSAPELFLGNPGPISPATDLYSVAAVFYRCLMGKKLSPMDTLRKDPPDCAESPLLENAPQTVRSMVSEILGRGLKTLARERYQSIGEMRAAFRELLDRIDCVGVTHWALWENGRRSVDELIRANPALRYLDDEKRLYPMRLEGDGSLSLTAYLEKLISPQGSSAMVLAEGGMGKTTMLLHTARLLGRQYSREMPAVFYISLAGWTAGDSEYIRRQLLLRLRFKPGENSYDSALHALHKLLEQPLDTRAGERPAVLLLLDGLNEAGGDITALIKEINLLNKLAGLRLLVSSRTGFEELETETVRLMPLNMEDVEQTLGSCGLLMPRSQNVLELLRTPLILSVYEEACTVGQQLDIGSENELMAKYFAALYEKETEALPENAPEHWQLDCALNFVLPAISFEQKRLGRPLGEKQLFKVLEKCWKVINSGYFRTIFPKWTGHSVDIAGKTRTAEQWYHLMVHSLLWQRLGMLMKEGVEASEGYRVFHQKAGEYLAACYPAIQSKIRKAKTFRIFSPLLAASFAVMAIAAWLLLPENYDVRETEEVISSVMSCLVSYRTHNEFHGTIYAGIPTEMFDEIIAGLEREVAKSQLAEDCAASIDSLCSSGDRVAWSKKPFDGENAKKLARLSFEYQQFYLHYLPLLKAWDESPYARAVCPGLYSKFSNLVSANDDVLGKLYSISCEPHIYNEEDENEKYYKSADKDWLNEIEHYLEYEFFAVPSWNGDISALEDVQREAEEAFVMEAVVAFLVLESRGEISQITLDALKINADENRETVLMALRDWEKALEYHETMLSGKYWAMDYVEAYLEKPCWENMLRAQAACHAAFNTGTAGEYPQPDLPEEEFAALLGENYTVKNEKPVRDSLIYGFLDLPYSRSISQYDGMYSAWLTYPKDSPLKNFAMIFETMVYREASLPALQNMLEYYRDYLAQCEEYLCLCTNLFLERIGEKVLWYELPVKYPTIAQGMKLWMTEADLSPLLLGTGQEWMHSPLQSVCRSAADDWDAFREKCGNSEDGSVLREIVILTGTPSEWPMPEWIWSNEDLLSPYADIDYYNKYYADDYFLLNKQFFWYDAITGSVNTVQTGQEIGSMPEGFSVYCINVAEKQVAEYVEKLGDYGFETAAYQDEELQLPIYEARRGESEMIIVIFDGYVQLIMRNPGLFVPKICFEATQQN